MWNNLFLSKYWRQASALTARRDPRQTTKQTTRQAAKRADSPTLSLVFALLCVSASLFTTGCAMQRLGVYSIQMQDVARLPQNEIQQFMFATQEQPDGTTNYIFEDAQIHIKGNLTNTRFDFTLTNLGDDPLIIHWDDAMYINQFGDSLKVIHNGVDYAQRFAFQDYSVVHSGESLMDFLLPADNVLEDPTNFTLWKVNYLFYDKKENIGQHVHVVLPVECAGQTFAYTFSFVIGDWTNERSGNGIFHWLSK